MRMIRGPLGRVPSPTLSIARRGMNPNLNGLGNGVKCLVLWATINFKFVVIGVRAVREGRGLEVSDGALSGCFIYAYLGFCRRAKNFKKTISRR